MTAIALGLIMVVNSFIVTISVKDIHENRHIKLELTKEEIEEIKNMARQEIGYDLFKDSFHR